MGAKISGFITALSATPAAAKTEAGNDMTGAERLDWQPASVAATWPEGSGVLYRTPYSGKSYPYLYEAHSWHRPDLMGERHLKGYEFLLLNPPADAARSASPSPGNVRKEGDAK